MALGYIFGSVTFIINKINQEASEYQEKIESIQAKMVINKVPYNLRAKIMEYFEYSQKKINATKMSDFKELSATLQRDVSFFQHQDLIRSVPMFKELHPAEVLSVIQKLK